MESVLKDMSPDAREEAKLYIFKNEIPQLFEVSHLVLDFRDNLVRFPDPLLWPCSIDQQTAK